MTEEKLMRALMISSSANPSYTQLLSAFRTGRFHSVVTQNKNSQEIFGNRFFKKIIDERYATACLLVRLWWVDLSTIITIIESLKGEISFGDALNEYLSKIVKEINNVEKGAEGLTQYINDDLRKMGVDIEKSENDYLIRS